MTELVIPAPSLPTVPTTTGARFPVRRQGRDGAAGLALPGHRDGRGRQAPSARERLREGPLRQQRQVGHGDDAHARIAIQGAEGVELFEARLRDPDLLPQDPPGRRV